SLVARLVRDQGRRHWTAYALAFACMAVIAASTSLAAWLMRDVINQVFIDRVPGALWWLSGAVVGLYACKGLATYGQQ
ncbi:hypothetical protein KC220_28025, partial [Mycobacterium tuberculosis]|nr:hypothetical protein [Mycobacterium tuberculosis]